MVPVVPPRALIFPYKKVKFPLISDILDDNLVRPAKNSVPDVVTFPFKISSVNIATEHCKLVKLPLTFVVCTNPESSISYRKLRRR